MSLPPASEPWAPGMREGLRRALHRYVDALPGTAFQKEILIGRTIEETVQELLHYQSRSASFVPGSPWPSIEGTLLDRDILWTDDELRIAGHHVMQGWQRPLMERLAAIIAESHGDVLEVGFGLGIASECIQRRGVRSHTIIEAHPQVLDRLERWRGEHAEADITVCHGRWQSIIDRLGQYDAILFDPYPMSQEEFDSYWAGDATYAAHFFPHAAQHLRLPGVLTYFSNESDSMSRRHQRALLSYFSTVELSVVRGLVPPLDCQYWWTDSMLIVRASKRREAHS